jgi:hypothetical protein
VFKLKQEQSHWSEDIEELVRKISRAMYVLGVSGRASLILEEQVQRKNGEIDGLGAQVEDKDQEIRRLKGLLEIASQSNMAKLEWGCLELKKRSRSPQRIIC